MSFSVVARLKSGAARALREREKLDFFSWIVSVFVAALLRLEFEVGSISPERLLALGIALGVVAWIVGKLTGLYRGRFRPASFDELVALLLSTAVSAGALSIVLAFFGPLFQIPRSLAVLAGLLFLLLSGALRAHDRYLLLTADKSGLGVRTLVYGAGQMAEAVINQLLADKDAAYLPVGLLDDDPLKANLWISGIRMKGSFSQIADAVAASRARALLVAISRVDSRHLQEIYRIAKEHHLEVIVLPSFGELLRGPNESLKFKRLSVEELIGRRAVRTDSTAVLDFIAGKRVLVTGAGGSIGTELCNQIGKLQPSQLVLLDRDETGLQAAQIATYGQGLLDSAEIALCDIREKDVLERLFQEFRPEIVFHVAALKHLPVLQRHPEEAWKTNVMGTLNVLQSAANANVQVLVNVSTDKAADPSSVLGRSKLLGEKLTTWFSKNYEGRFVSVRFGNVLGSRGSLVPTLAALIDAGKPLTITHPDATRYFMTAPEACQLVLQSTVLAGDGDVFVLDMGDPVKIVDVAARMIELTGSTSPIVFTGLREGEKLVERLYAAGTAKQETSHSLIWQMKSDCISPDWVYGKTFKILFGDERSR